ncbi:hypothetical protein BXY39_0974 [Eilatimonas milleporae]|uniref:Uncharacterized protein n=1 Tax=Eilatimonas milleporae TaxID=911205 RepID=A0A3M0CSH0_9PROT|nr:hypothetical protein BXY39_0974 [Eilatimonas milleporae]
MRPAYARFTGTWSEHKVKPWLTDAHDPTRHIRAATGKDGIIQEKRTGG